MTRYLTLLVFVLWPAAIPAVAQFHCPFPDSVAIVDTVSPAAYLPAAVGNEWHYLGRSGGLPSHVTVREVVSDTLIQSISYARIRDTQYEYGRPAILSRSFSYIAVTDSITFRYDRFEDATYPDPIQPASDFNVCYEFDGRAFGVSNPGYSAVYPAQDYVFHVVENGEQVEYHVPLAKGFAMYPVPQAIVVAVLIPGIGIVEEGGEFGDTRLIYAMIEGEVIGTRADSTYAWMVGARRSESSEEYLLTGYPNPASSDYYLTLHGSPAFAHVEVQVIDLLGRERRVSSFRNPVQMLVDVSGLEAGIYFAHVTANGTVASRRFLVVR